jgi:hypothetical protein
MSKALRNSGRSRLMTACLVGATVAAAGIAALAVPSQAKAITCIAQGEWTAIDASNSTKFAIAQNSQCQDMNAAYNYSHNDYIRGWYRDNSGTWHAGSRGYVWVTTCDCGWLVLLSDVANGTVVRGQGLNYAQYVEYVT